MKTSNYSTKSGFEVKDMDTNGRRVKMYLAKFDNIDSDGDVIRKGAFSKSISERGVDSTSNRKIAFLRHHDWQMPIGKFVELSEDSNGLLAVAEMGRSTIAEDAWKDYQDGIIREHSIGFQYIKDKMQFVEDASVKNEANGYFEIKEVILYEGSAVTFGANPLTNVLSVSKGMNNNLRSDFLAQSNATFNQILKKLSERTETSDSTYELEMKLKYLYSQIAILAQPESVNHSASVEPSSEASFNWVDIINKLNINS